MSLTQRLGEIAIFGQPPGESRGPAFAGRVRLQLTAYLPELQVISLCEDCKAGSQGVGNQGAFPVIIDFSGSF